MAPLSHSPESESALSTTSGRRVKDGAVSAAQGAVYQFVTNLSATGTNGHQLIRL
jgi:hypothetical protein